MRLKRTTVGGLFVIGCLVGALSCRTTPPPPKAAETEPPVPPKEYVCAFTEDPITVDGKADEPDWSRAPVIDDFLTPWLPKGQQQPRHKTRARMLWDREYLYFHADLDDPSLYATVTEHNGPVWENDAFELFLKPADDKPGYYEFEVNPLNTHFDMFFPQRGAGNFPNMEKAQPVPWESKVLKWTTGDGKAGWGVEGRIRWADLGRTGGRPNVVERWRFNLARCDFDDANDKGNLSTIGRMRVVSFHRHEDYPYLRFEGPKGGKPFGMTDRPLWTTSKLVGYPDPPPPFTIVQAFPKMKKIHQPIFVIEEPGTDDLLVVQHLGWWNGPARIVRVKNSPDAETSDVVFDGPKEIVYAAAFHPKYAQNRYVYLFSNSPITGEVRSNYVARYVMGKDGKLDPASRFVVWENPSNGHNGGAMEFGPDGYLWFTTGDTTSDSDQASRGQDLTFPGSAMIRIDVDNPADGKPYGIPKDNPFVGDPKFADARKEIWAHGFRNPWKMNFDRKTGHLWVGQNGQDLFEQVYVVEKGANYGWPIYEGSAPFHPHRKLEKRTKYVKPLIEHSHADARSLTGGVVYHGQKFPDLDGAYVYGDFSTGRIWAAKYDGKQVTWHKEIARTAAQLVGFYCDRHGDLFVCDDAGGLFKLAPAPKDVATPPFPRLLSQTGLFVDVAKHVLHPGVIPYDVNAPLWSDNAHKLRYIALPGDAKLDHTTGRGWNFPDGGVTVKTFALELEPGNPKSLRRLETRVMLKQQNNWAGYTYVWNDSQTDAELAPASGLDQTFTIKDPAAPGGSRKQTWHFPSRFECLVCHSRAANFALGVTDAQLDRDFDYGNALGGASRVDNQLRTLEHLGVLKVDAFGQHREYLVKDARAAGMNKEAAQEHAKKLTDTKGQREPVKSTLLAKPVEDIPNLIDPADTTKSLNARARSYLHANCAHCHVEAGGGNASVDLEFFSDAAKTKMFDTPPQSNILNDPNAKLIALGKPELSTIYHRVRIRGTGQMPPVGTNLPDPLAVQLLDEWIRKMPASTQPSR